MPAQTDERLDVTPLANLIEQRGGISAAGLLKESNVRKNFERARKVGYIDPYTADPICIRLGVHPAQLWGADWIAGAL